MYVHGRNDFKLRVNERMDVDVTWRRRGHGKRYWSGHLNVILAESIISHVANPEASALGIIFQTPLQN